MAAEYPTLPQRLLAAVDRYQCPRAQVFPSGSQWVPISANEMLRRIAGLSAAFLDLGIRPGDRVAIFAPNCPEWHVADFAATAIGAVIVPIYFRESPDRIEYIVNHAGPRLVFVAGEDQASRFAPLRSKLATVERVVCAGAAAQSLSADAVCYEDLIARAGDAEIAAYRRCAAERSSGELTS